jgi:hypothetical protein
MDNNTEPRGMFIKEAILAMVDLFTKLPDSFFTNASMQRAEVDAIFKPLTEDLYVRLTEKGCSILDLEKAENVFTNVNALTTERNINSLKEVAKFVNKARLGHEDPIAEKSFAEWETERQAIIAELSTALQPQPVAETPEVV